MPNRLNEEYARNYHHLSISETRTPLINIIAFADTVSAPRHRKWLIHWKAIVTCVNGVISLYSSFQSFNLHDSGECRLIMKTSHNRRAISISFRPFVVTNYSSVQYVLGIRKAMHNAHAGSNQLDGYWINDGIVCNVHWLGGRPGECCSQRKAIAK